jgi:hypothetical protein
MADAIREALSGVGDRLDVLFTSEFDAGFAYRPQVGGKFPLSTVET